MKIKPQGKIIATGEDGVPWELYENGYLLFNPEIGKDTLKNTPPLGASNKYRELITAIGFTDKVYAPQNSTYLFSLPNVEYIQSDKIDTSKVENMYGMFQSTYSLTYLDVSNWDTSKVTDMSYMFDEAYCLTNLDLSNWDTSKVTNMSSMFYLTKSLKKLDISKWNTNNVKDMTYMLLESKSIQQLNLSNINLSYDKELTWMLKDNTSLKLLDFSQSKQTNVEISNILEQLIHLDEIELPEDCVVLLPN